MARILFLTHVLPYPLDAGPKMRAYHVLRHLTRTHAVTLVSFVREEDHAEAVGHLRDLCAGVHTVPMRRSLWRNAQAVVKAGLHRQPAIIVRDEMPAMYACLAQVLAAHAFDAIHADQTSMAQYALWAHACSRSTQAHRPALVLDAHNALFQVVQRLAGEGAGPLRRRLLRQEAARLARYEAATYRAFDDVVFVTDEDRAHFDLPRARVIPICVDPAARLPIPPQPGAQRVTFLGALHWPPNADGATWFVEDVWPRVVDAAPGAHLTIIGKEPPAPLVHDRSHIRSCTITGYVADLTPYLAETAVFIVPLHAGGGMRVKILDAWCWGLPVVSTTIGAEGIRVHQGEDILLADSAATFAQAVVSLLRDETAAQRLRQGGRRTVEQEYDWRTVYRAWDGVHGSHAAGELSEVTLGATLPVRPPAD